jgi:hypothetical protein
MPKPCLWAARPVSPRLFYLLCNAWGLALGALALVAATLFFTLPADLTGDPAVTRQLGAWDDLYFAGYGIAGACILAGLLGRRTPVEAFGLCLFAASSAVSLAALVATIGSTALVSAGPSAAALIFAPLARLLIAARFVYERPPDATLDDLDARGPTT